MEVFLVVVVANHVLWASKDIRFVDSHRNEPSIKNISTMLLPTWASVSQFV